jgi:hypothetical protein
MNQPTRPQHNNAASRFTLDRLAPRILLGRLGDPQELSATAVCLANTYRATAQIRVTDET